MESGSKSKADLLRKSGMSPVRQRVVESILSPNGSFPVLKAKHPILKRGRSNANSPTKR